MEEEGNSTDQRDKGKQKEVLSNKAVSPQTDKGKKKEATDDRTAVATSEKVKGGTLNRDGKGHRYTPSDKAVRVVIDLTAEVSFEDNPQEVFDIFCRRMTPLMMWHPLKFQRYHLQSCMILICVS
jgi:hypothetical protein